MLEPTASKFGDVEGFPPGISLGRGVTDNRLPEKWAMSISTRASTWYRPVQYFTSALSRLTHSMAEKNCQYTFAVR